jgi:hypothetical protein
MTDSLAEELLSCRGVTSFTTTGLNENEAFASKRTISSNKYNTRIFYTPSKNFPNGKVSYSVSVSKKITPENVVRDFRIKKSIDTLLPTLVTDINDYSDEERLYCAVGLAYRLMGWDNPKGLEEGKRKYGFIDSVDIACTLSPYTLQYIIEEANKEKYPLKLTTLDIEKAGVRHA